MSQSSTFVQAVDGRFYKEPTVWGSDWFLLFDDDDLPLIVVRRFKGSTAALVRERAIKVLESVNITHKNLTKHSRCQRPFPPDMDIHSCYDYTFQLHSPIPVPQHFHAVVEEPSGLWDSCVYGFYSLVRAEDMIRCVLGMDIDPMISRALLAQPIYKKDQERLRPEICKKLYKQHPWLREVTRENWVRKAVEHGLSHKRLRLDWSTATVQSGS